MSAHNPIPTVATPLQIPANSPQNQHAIAADNRTENNSYKGEAIGKLIALQLRNRLQPTV